LAYLGYPLRGDVFYGGLAAKRLYLHAFQYELEFENKRHVFQSDISNFNGL